MNIEIFKCISSKDTPLYEQVFEGNHSYRNASDLIFQLNRNGHQLFRAEGIDNNDVIFCDNEYLRVKFDESMPLHFEVLQDYEVDNLKNHLFLDADLVDTLCVDCFEHPFEAYVLPSRLTEICEDFIGDVINLNGVNHHFKIYYNKHPAIQPHICTNTKILNREYKGLPIYSRFFVVEIHNGKIIPLSEEAKGYYNHIFYDYPLPFTPSKKALKNTIQVLNDTEVLDYV